MACPPGLPPQSCPIVDLLHHFRRCLCALLVAGGVLLLPAAEPAPPPAPAAAKPAPPAGTKPADPEVIVLPTIQVTAGRIKELDTAIGKLDKLIARERKKVKSTELDKALNNKKLSTAAALFGGNSAEHLSAIAATRVSLLESERAVLEDMKRPVSLAALAALETELEELRLTRRNLDNAEVPH